MLCPKPVVILRDDTWFDGTTKGMVHFSLSPSATTSTRCTPPRWSTPSLRCLCSKESLPQSVSRKWMRCCSLSTASTSAGSPTPTRSAPGCSTTLTRARLGCASRWSLEGKDNALLYADGRERETKPCCKKKIMHCLWVDWPRRTTPRWIWTRKSAWICSTGRLLTWAVRGQPARLFARGTICTDYARLGPFLTSFARRQMYLTGCIPCAHGWGGDEQANGGAAVGRWCRRVEGGERGCMRGCQCKCGGVRMRCAACTLTGWQWSSKWKSRDGTGEWKSWSLAQKKQAVHH